MEQEIPFRPGPELLSSVTDLPPPTARRYIPLRYRRLSLGRHDVALTQELTLFTHYLHIIPTSVVIR